MNADTAKVFVTLDDGKQRELRYKLSVAENFKASIGACPYNDGLDEFIRKLNLSNIHEVLFVGLKDPDGLDPAKVKDLIYADMLPDLTRQIFRAFMTREQRAIYDEKYEQFLKGKAPEPEKNA